MKVIEYDPANADHVIGLLTLSMSLFFAPPNSREGKTLEQRVSAEKFSASGESAPADFLIKGFAGIGRGTFDADCYFKKSNLLDSAVIDLLGICRGNPNPKRTYGMAFELPLHANPSLDQILNQIRREAQPSRELTGGSHA